jgi:hypothetical protein
VLYCLYFFMKQPVPLVILKVKKIEAIKPPIVFITFMILKRRVSYLYYLNYRTPLYRRYTRRGGGFLFCCFDSSFLMPILLFPLFSCAFLSFCDRKKRREKWKTAEEKKRNRRKAQSSLRCRDKILRCCVRPARRGL